VSASSKSAKRLLRDLPMASSPRVQRSGDATSATNLAMQGPATNLAMQGPAHRGRGGLGADNREGEGIRIRCNGNRPTELVTGAAVGRLARVEGSGVLMELMRLQDVCSSPFRRGPQVCRLSPPPSTPPPFLFLSCSRSRPRLPIWIQPLGPKC
jgi:hypothetical protein